MDRALLLSSTCLPARAMADATPKPSGLLDASGAPIPSTRPSIDIAKLPLIAPDALPPLPQGMQARLLVPANGAVPEIVLWVPAHAVSMSVPLPEKDQITQAAAALSRALGRALAAA